MPRDGSGVAVKLPLATAVAGTLIEASKYNATVDDIYSIFNTVTPIVDGGTGASTADGALTSLGGGAAGIGVFKSTNTAAIKTSLGITAAKPRDFFVFDMHFDALRGRGWYTGEVGGNVTYTVLTAATAGALTITLTSASTKPIANQLIVLKGTDGEYYSSTVASVAGDVLTFINPIPVGVATGGNLYNFYNNETHPNTNGYYAIADEFLREKKIALKRAVIGSPTPYLASPVTSLASISDANPGAPSISGWQVANNGTITGCSWIGWVPEATGLHRLKVRINKGGGASTLLFTVIVNGTASHSYTVPSNDVSNIWVDFTVTNVSDVIEFRASRAGLETFFTTDLEVYDASGDEWGGFSSGKHILFGDSWVYLASDSANPNGIIDRFRTRFPSSTFVNKGVGGNQASDLVARFDADIAAYVTANGAVDTIITIIGTNDYQNTNNVQPVEYGRNIGIIIAKSIALGITPILFTASVGSATVTPGEFTLSRRLAIEYPYYPADIPLIVVDTPTTAFTPTIIGTTVAGAGTYTVNTGDYIKTGKVVHAVMSLAWTAHTGTGNMKISGLPFNATRLTPVSIVFNNLTYPNAPIQGYVEAGANTIFLGTAATNAALTALAIDAVASIWVQCTYFTT